MIRLQTIIEERCVSYNPVTITRTVEGQNTSVILFVYLLKLDAINSRVKIVPF